MPYRRVNRKVLVKRNGRWETLKVHATKAEAEAHLKALYANVPEAKEEK